MANLTAAGCTWPNIPLQTQTPATAAYCGPKCPCAGLLINPHTLACSSNKFHATRFTFHCSLVICACASQALPALRIAKLGGVDAELRREAVEQRRPQPPRPCQPPPRSRSDVVARLSDSPILSKITVASFVLDGRSQLLDMWCCGQRPSDATSQPMYSWNLSEFFYSDLWYAQSSELVLYG